MGRLAAMIVLVAFLAGGASGYAAQGRGAARPVAAADTCQTFPETGKTVCGVFLVYWREHGGLAQQGLPISDELYERSVVDGKVYRVQYFERAVFEHHPENQPPYDVLLSLLGAERYRAAHDPPAARPAIIGQQVNVRGYGNSGYIPMRVAVLDIRERVAIARNGRAFEPRGKFVAVFVRVTNLGQSAGAVFVPSASLILADGHDREAHLSTAPLIGDAAAEQYRLAEVSARVEPGLATDAVLIFDVQPDATDFRLVVGAGYEPR